MSQDIQFKIIGANRLRKRLDLHKLALKPLRDYYTGTAIVVQRRARQAAPKDTMNLRSAIKFKPLGTRGRLPAGITVFVDKGKAPYAKYVHGYMHENFRQSKPYDRTKPHFPPISAIEGWAQRKGLNPWAVAIGIAKKGTPIVPFLKIGFNKSRESRNLLLAKASKDITKQWKKSRRSLK